MKLIRSIIPYIDQESFANELKSTKQLRRLFDLIRFSKVQNNEEARIELFGKDGSKDAFKQLRLRLRGALIEYILRVGIKFKNVDDYSQNYRICMNGVAVAKYLRWNNANDAAVEISETLIRATVKYEYTELTLSLARDLFSYFSWIRYNPAKNRKYLLLMNEMRDLYNAELEANQYYGELRAAYFESRGVLRSKLLSKAETYFNRMKDFLVLPQKSYQLIMSMYSIYAIRYELDRDYKKVIEVCDAAIYELQNRRVHRKAMSLHFNVYKIASLIHLRKYLEVEEITSYYFKEMTHGTSNWFTFKAYLMISKLHAREYQEAYEIQHETSLDSKYQQQPRTLLQTWTVYEAHIEFLVAIGKVKTDQPSKFRLNKFLNEIPLYTKDKRGLNIAILIIHILFLLQQRKYSQIIDRVDALKLYCYRYLRKDETFRAHCFIRMLLQMPRADFMRIRTERYAEPFLSKLRSVPLTVSEQSIEVEVIPYEDLWEMTVELLD